MNILYSILAAGAKDPRTDKKANTEILSDRQKDLINCLAPIDSAFRGRLDIICYVATTSGFGPDISKLDTSNSYNNPVLTGFSPPLSSCIHLDTLLSNVVKLDKDILGRLQQPSLPDLVGAYSLQLLRWR